MERLEQALETARTRWQEFSDMLAQQDEENPYSQLMLRRKADAYEVAFKRLWVLSQTRNS